MEVCFFSCRWVGGCVEASVRKAGLKRIRAGDLGVLRISERGDG